MTTLTCTFTTSNHRKKFRPCQGKFSMIDLTEAPFIILKIGKGNKKKKRIFFFLLNEVKITDLADLLGKIVEVFPGGIKDI